MAEKCWLLYTTRGCTFYHLTPHNQRPLDLSPAAIVLGDALRLRPALARLPEALSFKEFVGLPRTKLFLTPVEFGAARTRGSDAPDGVQVDSHGFSSLTNREYLELARKVAPNCLVTLTEELREGGGRKSLKRALAKTEHFLDETIAFKESERLQFDIYAPLIGDFEVDLRERAIATIVARRAQLKGVLLLGLFFRDRPSTYAQRRPIYEKLCLLTGLEIVLSSSGNPFSILEGRFWGIRAFETAFPFKEAEAGRALLYDVERWRASTERLVATNYQISRADVEAMFAENVSGARASVALGESLHAGVMRPLLDGCECYACREASRAYVYHLLKHSEMTGNVLLTIHNCWIVKQFLEFLNSELFAANPTIAIWAFFELFGR